MALRAKLVQSIVVFIIKEEKGLFRVMVMTGGVILLLYKYEMVNCC